MQYYKKTFREKISISAGLGIALAHISNDESKNPWNLIEHGVGTDADVIREWVDDIYDTYDLDGGGDLDRREIKKFVDQTFEKANIKDLVPYTDFDLDVFFDEIDVTANGLISKPELRGYLRKLGKKDPDQLLKKKIIQKIGKYVVRTDTTGRKYLELLFDPESEKTSTLGSQDHNAIEMNLINEQQYRKVNEAEDVAFDLEEGQHGRDGF